MSCCVSKSITRSAASRFVISISEHTPEHVLGQKPIEISRFLFILTGSSQKTSTPTFVRTNDEEFSARRVRGACRGTRESVSDDGDIQKSTPTATAGAQKRSNPAKEG